jgi:hypothetical protein
MHLTNVSAGTGSGLTSILTHQNVAHYHRWQAYACFSAMCRPFLADMAMLAQAFCAGGDVKKVVQDALAGNKAAAVEFFKKEFTLDYLIDRMMAGGAGVPHFTQIAIMDRVSMGGGVGLAMHGPFRIATERYVHRVKVS